MWAPPPTSDFFRARPPLVKGAGHIGPLFPEFRGWLFWFMASIELQGPQNLHRRLFLAPHCTLRLSPLSVGGNAMETGDCGPARHVGAGRWGLLGPTAHELLGRRHPGPRLSHMVGLGWGWKYRDSRILGGEAWHVLSFPGLWSFGAL